MTLTPKQDAFALAYFETGNQAEAYRQAYDVPENARDSWIYVEACQLLDHPKITQRLQELRDAAKDRAVYGVLQASEDYQDAMDLAKTEKNPAAMVSAINGRVKLFGLEAPKRSKVEHTGRNGGPIQTQTVEKTEAELIEQAQRLGIDPTALGLGGEETEGN